MKQPNYPTHNEMPKQWNYYEKLMEAFDIPMDLAGHVIAWNWIAAHQLKETGSDEAVKYCHELNEKLLSLPKDRFLSWVAYLGESNDVIAKDLRKFGLT